MSFGSSIPSDPGKYGGVSYHHAITFTAQRDPTTSDSISPSGQHYRAGDGFITFWLNSSAKSLWYLAGYNSGVPDWVELSGAGGLTPINKMIFEDGTFMIADPSGACTLSARVDTTAIGADKLYTKQITNAFTGTIGINPAVAVGGSAIANAGAASFANTQFAASADGFITLLGGGTSPAVVTETVDTFTAPATTAAVTAGVTGDIRVKGSSVAAGTNPVRSNSHANNEFTVEVQKSQAIAGTDATKVGLANFDSADFNVDANGFVQLSMTAVSGTSYPGLPNNLAFAKAANTTTFTGFDGTALSAANPANVWINHPTARSQLVHVSLVNPWQVIDAGGAGDMNGNSFGTSSGAWATDMPWYIYIVVNDAATAGAIAFSRVPNLTVAPAAGLCATRTSAVATTQGSMYFLDEVIAGVPTEPTVANFDGNPVVCVGGFRVQKAAVHNWIIQTPDNSDGIGLYHENTKFLYPVGQNGASATSHFIEAGVFPAFTNKQYEYSISRNGKIKSLTFYFTLTAAGATADQMVLTWPCKFFSDSKLLGFYGPATGTDPNFMFYFGNGASLNSFFIHVPGGTGGNVINSDITGLGADANFNVCFEQIMDIA